jgi:hypothetical protein
VQGRVAGGEVIHIHSADMRTLVALSFSPDGCQYAQRGPFVVSEGFYHSDAGEGQPLLAPVMAAGTCHGCWHLSWLLAPVMAAGPALN